MRRTLLLTAYLLAAMASTGLARAGAAKFYARRDYPIVGTAIAVADTNGDGIPDLIEDACIRVWLGNGDGTFRQGPSSPSTPIIFSTAMIPIDLNGDGNVDVVISGSLENNGWGIAVRFGNGDGTFQPAIEYPVGSTSEDIGDAVIGDFNADGIPDVATVGHSGIWLFLGAGEGVFNPGVLAYSFSGASGAIAGSDLNGDGKLDLVVTTTAGFSVFMGNGDGTFQAPESFVTSAEGLSVAIADLNQDGHPDIALAVNSTDYIYIYLGNGAGGFSGPTFAYLGGYGDIAIGDVNGDGIPDLVDDYVAVAFGNGDGTFQPPSQYAVGGPGSYSLVLADLKRDGRIDIVTQDSNWASVLLNNGKGKYIDGILSPSAGKAFYDCGTSADYNGDGKPDLATCDEQGIVVLFGTGQANSPFTIGPTTPLSNVIALLSGDLNNDGIPDLLVSVSTAQGGSGSILAYLGNGDGTFRQASSVALSSNVMATLGDFNHDGKLDFATAGNLLALGNGDGTFQTPVPIIPNLPTGTSFTNVAAGDLNNDGWSDLVLTDSYGTSMYVLVNNRHGGFHQSVISLGGGGQATFADLNGDGNQDVVVGSASTAYIYLGDGKGGLKYKGEIKAFLGDGSPAPALVADLNGDGIPDIGIIAIFSTGIFLGNGDGTFKSPYYIGTGAASALLAENLHGQPASAGMPDIVVPGASALTLINTTK